MNKQKSMSPIKNQKSPKVKRMRDINAPKLPVNTYGRFLTANLKNFRKKNEKSNDANIRLAAEWAKMSDQEKQPYRDEYQKAREEYYKQMEEYKKTSQYKDFMSMKKKESRTDLQGKDDEDENNDGLKKDKRKPTTSKSAVGSEGIKIFSKEFLDNNREQEKKLKGIRKQKNDAEEECERIQEQIDQNSTNIKHTRASNQSQENQLRDIEDTMSKWRRTVLETFAKAKLLDSLKLDQQKSTTEELVSKLEEMSHGPTASDAKKAGNDARLHSAVKQALAGLRLEFAM